ncbi:MAG: DUF4012 domain-containing protein [Actinomycetota bacterium]|nr:DUF4012 domain-containing protein [Actinomycetota bacterium]
MDDRRWGASPLSLEFPEGYWDSLEVDVPAPDPPDALENRTSRRRGVVRRVSRMPLWAWPIGALLVLAVVAAPPLLALADANGPAKRGAAAATRAVTALAGGDRRAAIAEFEQAGASFALAEWRLRGRLTSVGRAVPGIAQNLRASRTLVGAGRRVAETGADLARISEDRLRLRDGSAPVDTLRALAPSLERSATVLDATRNELEGVRGLLVLSALRGAADELEARLSREAAQVRRAADAARVLPAMLGTEEPRTYFIAFQNNAEIRGTAGLIGNWGELRAEGGKLRLERFGRTAELILAGRYARAGHVPSEVRARWDGFHVDQAWQQVNAAPDFPTVARIIGELYPKSGGRWIDGVIGIDVPGLASLLALTGPVTVPAWPVPVTTTTLERIVLHDAYERFPDQQEREAFLDALSKTVWTAFTSVELGPLEEVATVLGRAVRNGHLAVYMTRSDEQHLVSVLGADGAMPRVLGDALMLVNQNIAANKLDAFLARRVHYDVHLKPTRSGATLSGRLRLTLGNDAPPSGLPASVAGPYDDRFKPGENRTYLSVYSPLKASRPVLDGSVPITLDSRPDLGLFAHSTVLSLAPQESRQLQLALNGRISLIDGWYTLDVVRQPSVVPQQVQISVSVPSGWRIAEAQGLPSIGDREATGLLPDVRRQTVRLRLVQVPPSTVSKMIEGGLQPVLDLFGERHSAACLVRSGAPSDDAC